MGRTPHWAERSDRHIWSEPQLAVTTRETRGSAILDGGIRQRTSAVRSRRVTSDKNATLQRSALRRILVEVPDLDRGRQVTIRFANEYGANEKTFEIVNQSQLIHEIDSLALTAGSAREPGAR